jgi:putative ABC transport system permease protein
MPLLAPAQPRAWAQASDRAMRLQALAALALMRSAGAIGWLGLGPRGGLLPAGRAAAWGRAGPAPPPQPRAQGPAPLARGPFPEWVLADSRQQLPALSLSLMALLLALSANIGVATMVGSFRTTFTGWLDQRLASELYVFTADTAEAARLEAFLDGRADALLPILSAEARLFGLPQTSSASSITTPTAAAWPLLSGIADPWGALYAGDGVLVNEQMARRQDLSLGDPVTLSADVTLPVAGVYSDYGNPSGRRSWRWRFSGSSTLTPRPRISPSGCRWRTHRRSRQPAGRLRPARDLGPQSGADQGVLSGDLRKHLPRDRGA